MKPHFYIPPSEKIRVIMEMPEEPDVKFKETCDCLICDDYRKQLASAKESSILCADQEQATKIIHEFYSVHTLTKEGIYPIPEGYNVEVREELEYPIDHTSYPPYVQRAVITPKPSHPIESQEEIFDDLFSQYFKLLHEGHSMFAAVMELETRFTIARKKD